MMMREDIEHPLFREAFLLGLLLLLFFQPQETASQVVQGRVLDELSREPVPQAVVSLQNLQRDTLKRSITDTTGYFQLLAPREGIYFVHVRRIGYAENTGGPFQIGPEDTLNIELRLLLESIVMDEVTVEAERLSKNLQRNNFYRRQERGLGQYMTREDISQKMAPSPSRIFSNIPGVERRPDGHLVSSRHQVVCPMTLVVNGVVRVEKKHPLFDGGAEKRELERQPTIDELIQLENIEAIEVYRGTVGQPLAYTGKRTPCGAILIWTRF